MCVNHREASERGQSCPGSANAEAPSIEAIQQAVAEAFEVSIDDLSGRRPTLQINNYPEEVRKARNAAFYLCRELTKHNATVSRNVSAANRRS
jgi:chromosomal replication initiation ATPase DnaA